MLAFSVLLEVNKAGPDPEWLFGERNLWGNTEGNTLS